MTPTPTLADYTRAVHIHDEAEAAGRHGMIHDRADYVRGIARMVMHSRLRAEHRARFFNEDGSRKVVASERKAA